VVENLTKRFRIPLDRSTTLKYRVSHLRSAGRFRDLLALDDVSFDVPDGQFLGVVGANGSGKSTLLKVLSGIYRPSSGSVKVNGVVSPFLELGVGFNTELTARENVFVNGAILGFSRGELERRMDDILAFAELEQFADQKLKNYSSGMQVRLAFTVAIQADASILLMDEVLAVGDARFQAKCFDVFARYRREGRTVVLVTHDLAAVDLHCDRAILFDHGRMIADASAREVTSRYERLVGEAQDTDAGVEQPQEKDRWGSGAVRFGSIRLLGPDGQEHHGFATEEPMTVALDLTARDRITDLVIGLGIHRADGSVISGTNTNIANVSLPELSPGDQLAVQYRLPRLGLLNGGYRLTVAAHPRMHTVTYDHREQALEFTVTDASGRTGQVDLGGSWVVEERAGRLPARSRVS
jgi:lipopolysaccharide transport system ATP-binding protein